MWNDTRVCTRMALVTVATPIRRAEWELELRGEGFPPVWLQSRRQRSERLSLGPSVWGLQALLHSQSSAGTPETTASS